MSAEQRAAVASARADEIRAHADGLESVAARLRQLADEVETHSCGQPLCAVIRAARTMQDLAFVVTHDSAVASRWVGEDRARLASLN